MGLILDECLEKIRKCEILAEEELKALCEYVSVWSYRLSPITKRAPRQAKLTC
jgi:hypothetical protein